MTFRIPQDSKSKITTQIQKYLTLRNKAEMKIVDSNYIQALSLYVKAFATNQKPFDTDIYNAAVCASLTGDDRLCARYINNLLKLGLNYKLIESNIAFQTFLNSQDWKMLRKRHENNNVQYTYNKNLRKVLDSLNEQDQYYRRRPKGYQLYIDSIRQIDTSNVHYLKRLIQIYGFPNEYKIGISPQSIPSMPYDVLFIHQAKKGRVGQVYDFTPEIKNAMYKGSLDPRIGTGFIEHMNSNMELYYSVNAIRMYVFDSSNTLYQKQLDELPSRVVDSAFFEEIIIPDSTEENRINRIRAELGLESFNDYKKKVKYFSKDKRFLLSKIGGLIGIFINNPEKWKDLKQKTR
ncbi:MAG TPA: hypothetical protein VM802_20385 [Chitinophaga sp.]|uniref:hypothetical protein n=1 Tax=Chitinophaga sp. TaxID=1869181 RepID=UPI002C4227C1|nr:hypothetical protein [Chitinophaga sp.]HVI47247.1 hypothetical protein [Chitinophaga sp.]